MSVLLDNQVDTQNENLKIKIPSPHRGCDKIKKEEKQLLRKKILMKGQLYKAVSEYCMHGRTDFH